MRVLVNKIRSTPETDEEKEAIKELISLAASAGMEIEKEMYEGNEVLVGADEVVIAAETDVDCIRLLKLYEKIVKELEEDPLYLTGISEKIEHPDVPRSELREQLNNLLGGRIELRDPDTTDPGRKKKRFRYTPKDFTPEGKGH